jgi:carbon storage regulator
MLILTRRPDETVCITFRGELVRMTVLGWRGNQVRVGFEASDKVSIDREEIYESKRQGSQ